MLLDLVNIFNVGNVNVCCFRYIVECNTNVDPPAYLRVEGRSYDLSCITAEGQNKIPPFNPLTQHAWPDEETMGLDESQLQALKLALTSELAIIQGPPGTGDCFNQCRSDYS